MGTVAARAEHTSAPRAVGRAPLLFGLVAAGTIAAGALLAPLGVPTPPFIFAWDPAVAVAAPLAAVLLAGFVAVAPRLLDERVSRVGFALAVTAGYATLALALGAAREGPSGWYEVFDPARSWEAKNEYLPGLSALSHGPGFFVDRFAELVPSLPVHSAGHPPGLLLTLDALGIGSPAGMAALCIGAALLLPPLTYGLARELSGDERVGRTAALLVVLSPAVLDFGVVSADALYATLGVAAAWALLRSRIAGAVVLAVASFYAWSLLGVAAWAVGVRLLRGGPRDAIAAAAACGAALLVFYGALAAGTGFDSIGTLRSTHQVYEAGIASMRPYAYWLIGSPVAWAVAAGLPIAVLFVRAAAQLRPAAVALAGVVVVAAVGGFTKAETERIWLFLVPLACVAAADVLPPRLLRPVLGALAVQALASELLFASLW